MTSEQRFRAAVRGLLAIGVKPTPTAINRFFRRTRKRMNLINGREAKWRREELLRAGWTEPQALFDFYYNQTGWTNWSAPR